MANGQPLNLPLPLSCPTVSDEENILPSSDSHQREKPSQTTMREQTLLPLHSSSKDQTDPKTPPPPNTPNSITEAQYREICLRNSGLSISNPSKPFGSKECSIIGECNWNALTRHASTTTEPPTPDSTGFIACHPRQWHCSEKQANYRRLLAPNAEEFKSLITVMDQWETSKFFFFIII